MGKGRDLRGRLSLWEAEAWPQHPEGVGQLTLLAVFPGEACAAGALAADVVTAGTILTLAHAPTVLPVKCCWAAWRNRVGVTAEVHLGPDLTPATLL